MTPGYIGGCSPERGRSPWTRAGRGPVDAILHCPVAPQEPACSAPIDQSSELLAARTYQTRYEFAVIEDVDRRPVVDNGEREDRERDTSSNATAPAVRLIRAGRTNGANLRAIMAARATFSAPRNSKRPCDHGARHDIGVKYGHQRLEVALPGSREVGVDNGPLTCQVTVGRRRGTSDAAPGPARELPVASGDRSMSAAISSNGTPNMSCSTNARRCAGLRAPITTCRAIPTASASRASCSGSSPASIEMIGSGKTRRVDPQDVSAGAAVCSNRSVRRPWSATPRGCRFPLRPLAGVAATPPGPHHRRRSSDPTIR